MTEPAPPGSVPDRPSTKGSMPLDDGIGEEPHLSLHGETAARRQAITELLFFASVGDLHRCKKITGVWGLSLVDPRTADYDKRCPLHLSAAEGAYSVVSWLLSQGAEVNPVDRFKRTPLEDAVRGDHGEVASLLIEHGGKVMNKDGELVDLADSPLAGNVRLFTGYDPDWEVDPASIKMLQQIGEGEFGVVYKANWIGTTVAVKILKDFGAMAMGDFRTELNVLQKVHHPNTVQFLGAVTKSQPYMIVTEFMTGGSLLDLFKTKRRVTTWRAIQLAIDCARGMAYLHNRSPQAVVHRDLKPANIMLGGPKVFTQFHKTLLQDETGVLKIADFGLSKSLKLAKPKRKDNLHGGSVDSDDSPRHLTAPPNALGAKPSTSEADAKPKTPSYKLTGETGSYRYMAPEVFRHEQYNNKVDVYSFAMICFQLFEGIAPFANLDPVEAARAAAMDHKRPQWGTGPNAPVLDKIKALVEACWSADPDARPDFEEVVDRFEAICKDIKPTVTETLPPSATVSGGGKGGGGDGGCCALQ